MLTQNIQQLIVPGLQIRHGLIRHQIAIQMRLGVLRWQPGQGQGQRGNRTMSLGGLGGCLACYHRPLSLGQAAGFRIGTYSQVLTQSLLAMSIGLQGGLPVPSLHQDIDQEAVIDLLLGSLLHPLLRQCKRLIQLTSLQELLEKAGTQAKQFQSKAIFPALSPGNKNFSIGGLNRVQKRTDIQAQAL